MAQLPRRCPICGQDTIVGHGRRRKQAHDERHDWTWVRRGRCPACQKTFTILPTWLPPSGHYSYCCRQQASEWGCQTSSLEQSAPHCKDPIRLPPIDTSPVGLPEADSPLGQRDRGLTHVEPSALGAGFAEWCVKQGWLVQRGKEYFASKEGIRELGVRFDIVVERTERR